MAQGLRCLLTANAIAPILAAMHPHRMWTTSSCTRDYGLIWDRTIDKALAPSTTTAPSSQIAQIGEGIRRYLAFGNGTRLTAREQVQANLTYRGTTAISFSEAKIAELLFRFAVHLSLAPSGNGAKSLLLA